MQEEAAKLAAALQARDVAAPLGIRAAGPFLTLGFQQLCFVRFEVRTPTFMDTTKKSPSVAAQIPYAGPRSEMP